MNCIEIIMLSNDISKQHAVGEVLDYGTYSDFFFKIDTSSVFNIMQHQSSDMPFNSIISQKRRILDFT